MKFFKAQNQQETPSKPENSNENPRKTGNVLSLKTPLKTTKNLFKPQKDLETFKFLSIPYKPLTTLKILKIC